MTARRIAAVVTAVVAATVLSGCGGHSDKPTAQERDLGPVSTGILGGTADSRYLHVFSASITVSSSDAPRFSGTMLYVGSGSDRLMRVTTPLGTASLNQPLSNDSAVPISVVLQGRRTGTTKPGATVSVSLQLAGHGTVGLVVPLVGPVPTPAPTS